MFSSDNHLEIFYSQTILSTHIFGPQINIFAQCSPLFSKRMGQHLGFMKKPFGKCNLFYRISALLLLKRNNIEIFEEKKQDEIKNNGDFVKEISILSLMDKAEVINIGTPCR